MRVHVHMHVCMCVCGCMFISNVMYCPAPCVHVYLISMIRYIRMFAVTWIENIINLIA